MISERGNDNNLAESFFIISGLAEYLATDRRYFHTWKTYIFGLHLISYKNELHIFFIKTYFKHIWIAAVEMAQILNLNGPKWDGPNFRFRFITIKLIKAIIVCKARIYMCAMVHFLSGKQICCYSLKITATCYCYPSRSNFSMARILTK